MVAGTYGTKSVDLPLFRGIVSGHKTVEVDIYVIGLWIAWFAVQVECVRL